MPPLEPDFDPWTDTTEQRGQEHDDPFAAPPGTPLGRAPENIGVPNLAPRPPWGRSSHSSRGRVARAALLGLLLAPAIVRAVVWAYDTLLSRLS